MSMFSSSGWGGALSGAGTGAAFGPWGAGIGALAGMLLGSSEDSAQKKQQYQNAMLQAKAAELSPWLSSSAQQAGQNVDFSNKSAASPWVGAASLAKSWKEIQDQKDQKDFLDKISSAYGSKKV